MLYGEEHPLAEKIGTLTAADLRSNPDYLIILGTSLKVHGLRTIVKAMAQAVHARKGKVIYVNKTAASFSLWKDVIDFHVEMDCDRFVKLLKGNHPEIWMKQTKVDKLIKLALMKNAPEDKENLAARPKAKVKRAGVRKPLIQKVTNGEVQKKRKAVGSGGTIKNQPTPVKRTRVRDTKKASSRSGRGQPAKTNITKPAKPSVTGSAKESQDGGRPAKRLKVAEPTRKSKGDLKDTKTTSSIMVKITCQPSPPTTSGSRIEKRCPSDPPFLVAFGHPSVPSTPSRSRKSKWENILPFVRLNTPERSCSPSPSAGFSVEILSPRKTDHFLDPPKALKSEPKEDLAPQGPNLRRSTRARRNTIL